MSGTVPPREPGEPIQRHGSAEPLATADKQGVWPTCFAYLRGRDPSTDEILGVRAQMVQFCQVNRLYLARIFHDLDVEPTTVDYPSFHELLETLSTVETHTVLLADLEFVREVSPVLVIIATGVGAIFPHLQVKSFINPEVYELLARRHE